MKKLLPFLLLVACTACTPRPPVAVEALPLAFRIEGEDAGAVAQLFGPAPTFDLLHRGMDWSEGPLILDDGSVLVSDVPRNHILRWSPATKRATIWLENSGSAPNDYSSEPGSNGLWLDREGRLLLCQHGARQVARLDAPLDAPVARYVPLATHYQGKRFNSPNDLVQAADGSIFFTDPIYGLPGRENSEVRELDFCGVYRIAPDGAVTLLTDELSRPNGIGLSPDERTLYVANSDRQRMVIMAYPVLDTAFTLGPGRVFNDATELVGQVPGSADGMTIARDGTLFATSPGGVWVFRPDGSVIAKIHTGTRVSNVALSPNEEYLCLSSDYYLLRVPLRLP